MRAYYNEIDPYAAQWLRNLIAAGQIAPGDVDERSIVDVQADDLRGYSQAHFFAGIGGWSVALRLASWPDGRPVWTGSCPCQPFSAAGAGKAADDERHLWPAWASLIAECRPRTIFGEQVEAAIGWGWLDAVFTDLEAQGYACGSAVLPACGVGAPHIRNRLWFVAHADGGDAGTEWLQRGGEQRQQPQDGRARELGDASINGSGALLGQSGSGTRPQEPLRGSSISVVLADADAAGQRLIGRDGLLDRERAAQRHDPNGRGDAGSMANTERDGGRPDEPKWQAEGREADGRARGGLGIAAGTGLPERERISREARGADGAGARQAAERGGRDLPFWTDAQWLPCTDGKARPVEPGSFPLAHGVQRRPSKLRAYGNAIVPQIAAEFIAAVATV